MATLSHAHGQHFAAAPAWLTTALASDGPVTAEAAETGLSAQSSGPIHHSTLRIRSYSISDLPALLRFPGVLRLDVPNSLLLRRSSMPDLPSALPVLRKERPALLPSRMGNSLVSCGSRRDVQTGAGSFRRSVPQRECMRR